MNARIALPAADRGFKLQRRDGLVLITPARTKMSRADWREEELIMRSLVVREHTGEVVSVGFPKFFNRGESGDGASLLSPEDRRLDRELAAGEPVHYTEKVDGSLMIRSVVDGAVMIRTRGTLAQSDHTRAMSALAAARYPALLDPAFAPEASLLLEFVSPRFRVVVGYETEDLTLLGAVCHRSLRLADMPALEALAGAGDLRLVDLVELPSDPVALVTAVRAQADGEGIVARCDSGQTLVKIKSASYLALHRLRFALSARVVREVCEQRQVSSLEDFGVYLAEQGADFELVSDARPLVDAYLAALDDAAEEFAELAARVPVELAAAVDRKAFAVGFAVPLGGARTGAAFALADGDPERAQRLLRQRALDERFAALEAADDRRLMGLAA